jgi:hypothetical protein
MLCDPNPTSSDDKRSRCGDIKGIFPIAPRSAEIDARFISKIERYGSLKKCVEHP